MLPQIGPLFMAAILAVVGLGIIASGEVFLAIREIALNTRSAVIPEEFQGNRSSYAILRIVVSLNDIVGALMIAGAAFLAYSSVK